MTLREREELTAAVDKAFRDVDWELVKGTTGQLSMGLRTREPETTEIVRELVPEYDRYYKLETALAKDDPVEPWTEQDIDTVLDICSVKATCCGLAYKNKQFFKQLEKYQLAARQSERLRELFKEYLVERLRRSEFPHFARLMILHADAGTIQFMEMVESQMEVSEQWRIRRFREMILNRRTELR